MKTKAQSAKMLGLTEPQFDTLGRAAMAVYCLIGGDLGCSSRKDGLWTRKQLLEILFDASRIECELMGVGLGSYKYEYPDGPEIAKLLRNIRFAKLTEAMKFHFEARLWE